MERVREKGKILFKNFSNPSIGPDGIPRPPFNIVIKNFLILGTVLVLYLLAAINADVDPIKMFTGFPVIIDFIFNDLIPPNWSYYHRILPRMFETWNIALISTTFAVIIAFPVSFLAAGNINRSKVLHTIVKLILNIIRTIPDLILAVVFVAIFGIGAFPGVLALCVFSFSILVKLMSETIESIDRGPIEAITATGGNIFQIIAYAVIPQIMPQYVSYALYVLEINIRASLVLGYVGAGGIGLILRQQMSLFNFGNVSMILLMTFIAVTLIDLISNNLRKRLL